MTQYKILRTGTWEVSLPADWSQGQSSDRRSLYFETADGTKGLYVTTWALGARDDRSAEDVAEAFQAADLMSMKQSAEHSWHLVSRQLQESAQACIAVTDLLASEKYHRTVVKILAAPPLVVTATFHDYACTDYPASRAYFAGIVDSLRLHGLTAQG
ncbi:MAG: hypothetical protein ACREX0_16990 [Noviherbaspirillum sp.]